MICPMICRAGGGRAFPDQSESTLSPFWRPLRGGAILAHGCVAHRLRSQLHRAHLASCRERKSPPCLRSRLIAKNTLIDDLKPALDAINLVAQTVNTHIEVRSHLGIARTVTPQAGNGAVQFGKPQAMFAQRFAHRRQVGPDRAQHFKNKVLSHSDLLDQFAEKRQRSPLQCRHPRGRLAGIDRWPRHARIHPATGSQMDGLADAAIGAAAADVGDGGVDVVV